MLTAPMLTTERVLVLGGHLRRSLDPIRRKIHAPSDFEGMCAIASWAMTLLLRRCEENACFVYGSYDDMGHCWVEWRGRIVDLTATQFACPEPVFIIGFGKKKARYEADFSDEKALEEVATWDEQSPFLHERDVLAAVDKTLSANRRRARLVPMRKASRMALHTALHTASRTASCR